MWPNSQPDTLSESDMKEIRKLYAEIGREREFMLMSITKEWQSRWLAEIRDWEFWESIG